MNRIIFTNDFLYHASSHEPTYHVWLASLIEPAINMATGKKISLFAELLNSDNNTFDRNHFFALSNITDIKESYFVFDIKKISDKSWNYLSGFISKNDFIIGIEMGFDLRQKLSELGICYINFWFHSFHLFDDICFMLNTNNKKIFKKLLMYQIPKQKFDLYTAITKQRLNEDVKKLNLDNNCCIFIGQTMTDKSVECDGIFLNITNFPDELEQLHKECDTIYYVPHPYCQTNQEVNDFIKARPYIKMLSGVPTYTILASKQVKKVVAISSSVIYEASFFGHEIQYLYKPLFVIDEDFGPNTYISIYNDYFNPDFWCDIFDGYFPSVITKQHITLFDVNQSVVRKVLNSYHGYAYLDSYKSLSDKIAQIQKDVQDMRQQRTQIDRTQIDSNNWFCRLFCKKN